MNNNTNDQRGTDPFANRLRSAIAASGDMTVEAIARKSGVPANDIRDYAAGSKSPTLSDCRSLADALEVPSIYLTRPLCEVYLSSNRKRYQLDKHRLRQILIDIQVAFENYYNIEDVLEVQPFDFATEHRVSRLPSNADEVECIAGDMRSILRIGPEELQPPVHVALDASVRLLPFSGHATAPNLLDGCVVKSDRGDKAIAFDTCAPIDRQRFTLARELGHLIMGDELDEALVDKFAAAFLMPGELVANEFKSSNGHDVESAPMGTWLELKRKFGCSIAALNARCHDLGLIDQQCYTRNSIRLSYLGWRKHEPNGGLEEPQYRRYADLCFDGWRRGLITRSKLSELLGDEMDVDEIPWSQ